MEASRYIEEENKGKKVFGKKKDGKTDKKDKGYIMFEEENSEEEILVLKENRTPMKLKKHSKPSFKFAKRPKEKEKEKDEKRKDDKEKKKEEKLKAKKKKFGNLGSMGSIPNTESVEESPTFGVALELAVQRNRSHDGILLPAVFRECVDYIEEYGLTCEGIYRISGVKSKVQALKEAYNKQIPVYLKEYEPSVVASLLKQFLRELPEPVLTAELMPKFEQASTIKNVKQKVEEFQHLIERLPDCNRFLLSWTIVHMTHVIAREKQNKMSLQNVSIVLSPTLQISHRVLNVLFTYSKILFRDTGIKKYVPPLKPVTSRWSLDLPDSPNSLEEELHKQESLLDELHKELMKVKDTNKEEQLWEVQRVVTGLKRKLKLMKKAQEGTPGRSPKLHKPLPPSSLDLKRKHKIDMKEKKEDLDLTLQAHEANATSSNKQGASDNMSTKKNKKMITTPSKQITSAALDFGDIEKDSSAQSQRQRTDRPDVSFVKADLEIESSKSQNFTDGVTKEKNQNIVVEDGEVNNDSEVDKDTGSNKQSDAFNERDEEIVVKSDSAAIKDDDVTIKTQDNNEQGDDNKMEKEIVEDVVEDVTDVKSSKEIKSSQKCLPGESKPVLSEDDCPASQISATVKKTEDQVSDENVSEGETSEKLKSDIVEEGEIRVLSDESSIAIAPDVKVEECSMASDDDEEEIINRTADQEDKFSDSECDEPSDGDQTVENNALAIPSTEPPDNTAEERVIDDPSEASMGGVEPEKLAARLSLLVQESEEDINQRVMSEFVQDFGIEKTESLEQDEEYVQMLQEQQSLLLEEEELGAIGDELRQKIETEQNEAERLREEIMEIQVMREDIYSSDYNSSTESSSDDDSLDGEGDLESALFKLMRENTSLELQNKDLCDKIHQERQICLEVKVQIRMIQAKQLESSMNNQLDLLL